MTTDETRERAHATLMTELRTNHQSRAIAAFVGWTALLTAVLAAALEALS